MAIARKPKTPGTLSEAEIKTIIHKGGSVASERARGAEKSTALLLRIPPNILGQVDSAVKARQLKTPRHTWILEAILEKLNREAAVS